MRLIYTLIIFCTILSKVFAQNTHQLETTTLTSRTVISGIDIPWEIHWGPDNHIWMTERYGRVSRVNPTTGKQDVLLDLSSEVYNRSEAGLLGLVLHPDFANNPYVYFAYTYVDTNSILEKLVRYTYENEKLTSPLTLVHGIKGNTTHIGSRLLITADNKLLMTTGDAQDQSLPQKRSSLVGKLLRINLDGSIPADNPNPNSLIWSSGHRNAQGLCLAPNGILYSSEHGPTTDDELNIIKKNRNYGWPTVHGLCDSPPESAFCIDSNVVEPLVAWTPTIAPSDIAWYDHPAIPEWRGKLLMTVLKNKQLIAFEFNDEGTTVTKQTTYLQNDFGRLRDICFSTDGKVYLATNGNSWSNTQPFTHSIIELSNKDYVTTNLGVLDNLNLKIGPNPLKEGESLKLRLPDNTQGILSIYNLVGNNVLTTQIDNNLIPLELPQGVYIWQLELINGQSTKGKLIIR